MSACQVCTGVAEVSLCGHCQRELRAALRALPELLADLEITATRRDRIGEPAGGSGDGPLSFRWAPSDLAWAAGNTLTTWVRHLVEARGMGVLVPAGPACRACRHMTCTVIRAAGDPVAFLLAHLASIACDEAAGQLWSEIVSLRRAIPAVIDRPEPRLYAGRCDSLVVRFELDEADTLWPVAVECGADLYYRRAEQTVRCRSCGARYSVATRRAALRARVPNQVATAAEIAAGLTTLDKPVRAQTIHTWATRGLLPRRGHDSGGRTLFLVGDVLRLLDSTAERLARRRVRA